MERNGIFSALGLDPNVQINFNYEPVRTLEVVEHKDFDLGNCADLYSLKNTISGDNKVILHIKQRHYFSSKNNVDRNEPCFTTSPAPRDDHLWFPVERSEFIEDQRKLEKLISHLKGTYNLRVVFAENISEEFLRLLELMNSRIEAERKDQSHMPADTWNLLLTYWNRMSHRSLPMDRRDRAASLYFIIGELKREIDKIRYSYAQFKENESAADKKHKKMFLNWNIAEINPESDILKKLEIQCRRLEEHELLKNGSGYFNMGAVLKAFIDGNILIKSFSNLDAMKETSEMKKDQYVPIVYGHQGDMEKSVFLHNDCTENKLGLIEISPL